MRFDSRTAHAFWLRKEYALSLAILIWCVRDLAPRGLVRVRVGMALCDLGAQNWAT